MPCPEARRPFRAAALWRVLRHFASAALLIGATACSGMPEREEAVQPLPPTLANAAVTLQDRGGEVSTATKTRDLAKLRAEGRGDLVQHHLGVLTAAGGELKLFRGNSARLLVDGPQTFGAMKAAIAEARERVLFESYIVEDDGVALEFADLLLRKAAEGVKVALLYDSVGSMDSDPAFFERLRQGGVAVCAFNPVNPLERPGYWGLLQRNHRKMLAVDSDVAFTGGINLSNVYSEGSFGSGSARRPGGSGGKPTAGVGWTGLGGLGGSSAKGGGRRLALDEGWRDTQVELRGPVVGAMALVFRESWLSQGCPGDLPPAPPPRRATAGERVVKVIAGNPEEGINPTYRALLAAVDASVLSVHLTMAYFAPGPDMVKSLSDAAARGVDVQLVLPGRSDVQLVLHAARSYYTQLLEAGVRIHEMTRTVMHAKTAVIDGVFSTVGSSNLDWRSIVGNNEIDVIVLGDDFGQELEALFQEDVMASSPIEAAAWDERGLKQRFLEFIGRLMEPLL